MVILSKLCALAAIIYLVFTLIYPLFKPMTRKRKEHSRDFIKRKRNQKKVEKYLYFKDIVLRRLSNKFFLSDIKRNELNFLIKRLDLKITPEEIRLKQILYVIGAVGISLIAMNINTLIGYGCLIFVVLGWLYPVDELEKMIEKKNNNILADFPSFYNMLYYQYARSINIYLADVVKDFLPNANEDMAAELEVFLDNIEYGEEYALKQLKKRVPLRHIIKFCDIMETRLRGYDNISQMTYLKNELYDLRVMSLEDELHRREQKNARMQFVLIVVLAIYIVIYYYFMFVDAIRMFS
ncbi:MAG TPA: hypothetical protein DEF39_09955 [Hungateiclostridium thermocellum]|jgi:Flp pilus assembly protein TadB|uniref:Flp pilus assembly protein TadB n=2 Tax=Acetivibrio thermocellus TaxID=1515 RepID=A3DD37_ACET2|nr:hypothetical protein [Acetivibrio thermocellus]CDG35322.1 hypothetical protein CTHBC1_0658 [Acetivibrio thermocellus BC1]ABN51866.1 hypothetical protein Cthe_0631 [Acetivibrio thermocellus ATCC 27405]ADU74658.1 hypothetical protein Clo1313_1597 [Acetivibrio thermocellus DSM 1313]ALX08601.1 hypothetical protein AD2_01608 [Acetivibrio thermocellus AD2]ANV76350.1 hypothetical protein LQRI_1609 [Acetivibrio thermocellus DSM 2360]